MRQRLAGLGIHQEKIIVGENWVVGDSLRPQPFPPGDPLTVLYSGNLGVAHEIDTISQAMLALRDESRIGFVFAGSGAKLHQLQELCNRHRLHNIDFLPYQDRQQFSDLLATCHVGLVTLKPECSGTLVPSKMYSLMAAGRPMLFIGPASATPALHIRDHACGWHREAGDVERTVSLLRHLIDHPEEILEAGAQAQMAMARHFNRDLAVEHLARLLTGAKARAIGAAA
jgi:glycosyltransferase involved in cell wall biosynthesis